MTVRGRGACARGAARAVTAAAVTLAALATALPAQGAVVTGDSRHFHDGLDSRWSAYRLVQSANAAGYAGVANNSGRSANQAWVDGLNSTVFGLFGHANAGVFQVDEGPSDTSDQFLAGGLSTDLVSLYGNVRFFTEYLPYVDVDDMRILVLAGCYTANSSAGFGNMPSAAIAKGVDATIAFPDVVYFPKTTAGTAISNTNYSGNYFWDRFSAHSQAGASVSVALSRARTDLVTKEGSAGGWDRYSVRGAVANPGAVRMTPVGTGQPLDSTPLGVAAYASFSELTPVDHRRVSTGTGEVTEVTTAEGVLYRVREDGTVLDAVAEVAAEGAETVTPEQAQQVAEAFVRTNVAEFDGRWRLTASHVVSHFDDDRLWGATWHLSGGTGQADRAVTVEVDRRTRVVTYFADLRTSTLPGVSRTSEQQAIDTALTVADGPGRVSAELVRWGVPRWIVTIDRGLEGRAGFETPDIEQVVVDARNGSVIATTTT